MRSVAGDIRNCLVIGVGVFLGMTAWTMLADPPVPAVSAAKYQAAQFGEGCGDLRNPCYVTSLSSDPLIVKVPHVVDVFVGGGQITLTR